MRIAKAQRVLRSRLAYLDAKIAAGYAPTLEQEHDALDLALRILKWRDDIDVELEVQSQRVATRVLPKERRLVARAISGDELRVRVEAFVIALQRAGRAA